jgi:hypothetical protein
MTSGKFPNSGFLKSRVTLAVAIFLLAFGVRVLSWHDTRLEVGKVQTAVTADYKRISQLLSAGGLRSFFSSSSPLADLNNLGHPPGYSILLALIYKLFGQSDTAVQFVQIFADASAAVFIFLIVAELLPVSAGATAGLFAALSPQFAWNSVLLLPDSICVLPILIAVYLLSRAAKNPRLVTFVIVGALIGLSCWLRANAMLLTFFFAAAVPLVIKKENNNASKILANPDTSGQDAGAPVWRFALAVVFGTLLIVLPLTIRNAIVFHRFIPLSLGAGQTLLEGIADYDKGGQFGVPSTDIGIMKQEAEIYQRPDYFGTLFDPDGVERERTRLSRGFAIIRSHPLWFAGVMARRASSMMRLERSRLISLDPPVSHTVDGIDRMQPVWAGTPDELVARGVLLSPQAQTSTVSDTCCWLTLMGDTSRYGDQFSFPIGRVSQNVDYVLVLPIETISGRMKIAVKSQNGITYSTAIVEAPEILSPADPLQKIILPFVSRNSGELQTVLSNEASSRPNPVLALTEVRLYELGPARFLWTRYPRFVIHAIQKIFITAVMLPLAIIGLLIVIFRKQSAALVILSVVPIYFFAVQSIVHTEYRYALAVNYFLFAFAAIAIPSLITMLMGKLRSFRGAHPRSTH